LNAWRDIAAEELTVHSADGLTLEAALDAPEPSGPLLVLCHPHPQMGGTMNAPLLLSVRDELVRRGWGVLRFNFRGVEGSQGTPSTGEAETADVQGAIAYLREGWPAEPVAVAGWSFGGAVALRVASQAEDLVGCAGIAPSLRPRPGVTAGLPRGLELPLPCLVVCGANDDIVSPLECRRWADEASARFVEVKGANHFFWGRYERLAEIVANFLDELV